MTERIEAKEVQLRAERKAGTFLKTLERDQGGSGRFGSSQAETNHSDYAATMEEAGISRPTAHRWQKIADVPEDEFEHPPKLGDVELQRIGPQEWAVARRGRRVASGLNFNQILQIVRGELAVDKLQAIEKREATDER